MFFLRIVDKHGTQVHFNGGGAIEAELVGLLVGKLSSVRWWNPFGRDKRIREQIVLALEDFKAQTKRVI